MQPSLNFQRALAIYCLDNTIGVEFGDNEQPKKASKMTIYVPCEKTRVKYHGGMWYPSKKSKKMKQKYQKQLVRTIKNVVKIPGSTVSVPRIFSCALDALQIINLRE